MDDEEATSPPRPISGTIGGRVRVLLGSTGKNWMLLTNHDNGETQWQTTDWKGFTNAVTKQVLNCEKKGRYVKEIAVGPTGAWFVNGVKRNGTGNHSWWGSTSGGDSIKEFNNSHHGLKVSFGTDEWGSESYVIVKGTNGYLISNNVNSGLTSRIIRIHKKKGTIKFVRLFNNDSYFMKDSDGSQWLGLSSHVEKEVKKYDVKDLAIAEDGSWVVIHADHFVCSQGVDDGLQKSLTTFFRLQRERNTQRANAIREYHDGVRRRREAREEAERQRLAREAAEEEERQRLAREAAEEAERQRLAREAAEEAERQRLAREAAEEEERQRLAITQLSALERESDARIQQEMASIKEMEDILVKRKRSIKSIISDMPAKRRASILQAIGDDVDDHHESKEKRVSCVVCHDETAVMAVVPCGHHCLCEDCSATIAASPVHSRFCPLCRSYIQSTLKIYSTL